MPAVPVAAICVIFQRGWSSALTMYRPQNRHFLSVQLTDDVIIGCTREADLEVRCIFLLGSHWATD